MACNEGIFLSHGSGVQKSEISASRESQILVEGAFLASSLWLAAVFGVP